MRRPLAPPPSPSTVFLMTFKASDGVKNGEKRAPRRGLFPPRFPTELAPRVRRGGPRRRPRHASPRRPPPRATNLHLPGGLLARTKMAAYATFAVPSSSVPPPGPGAPRRQEPSETREKPFFVGERGFGSVLPGLGGASLSLCGELIISDCTAGRGQM